VGNAAAGEERDGTRRWVVNHKQVQRIYREEGLAMRRKEAKRLRAVARTARERPARANQAWTMDFTKDRLASRRNFRTLNLMDGYTREALWIEVDTSLPGQRVVRVLEWLKQTRGVPEVIPVDNGPEFISQALDRWAFAKGKFRDECLNQNWFVSLAEARQGIEAWRVDYNTARPHSSRGYRTPAEFAAGMDGETGCGKAAAWKSTNHFSTPLGNPANPAGSPLSHSPGDDGIIPHAAEQIQNQAPSTNLWLDQKRGAGHGASRSSNFSSRCEHRTLTF
jgi:putative transposase